MTVTDIPYEFVSQRVELGWNEIKFGLDQRLIKPKAAIDRATEQLCAADGAQKEAVELASRTENESVAELVLRLADAEKPPTDERMKAKWLYLVLAWLFENRQSLVDALGMVESVYSDFDYPKEVAPFVRYMPMDGPDLGNREQNEARLFDRWNTYLNRASKRFGRETKISGIPHKR
jgi:hypothetical protein